jgi:hypothetical protein
MTDIEEVDAILRASLSGLKERIAAISVASLSLSCAYPNA